MGGIKQDEVVRGDDVARDAGDGIDRRNFLSCMAWAGTGLLWTMAGGVPQSRLLTAAAETLGRVGEECGRGLLVCADQ